MEEETLTAEAGYMKETFSISVTSKFAYLGVAQLALALRNRLGLRHFVETGSFMGGTTRWATQYFSSATSIEINPTFHRSAASETPDNARFLLGDSRDLLPVIVAGLDAPALFYLDAHNQDGLFGTGPDDCPALEELRTVLPLRDSAILIDDASNFANGIAKFPSMQQLEEAAAYFDRVCAVAFNMVAIVPRHAGDLLVEWVASQGTPASLPEDDMSEQPEQPPAPAPVGGFVSLNIDDTKVEIIRHPDNKHLDNPAEHPDLPPAA